MFEVTTAQFFSKLDLRTYFEKNSCTAQILLFNQIRI